MAEHHERYAVFAALHRKGEPLVLFNAWDAGSAAAIADAGAPAVATGSWSVAAANGFADAEGLPTLMRSPAREACSFPASAIPT